MKLNIEQATALLHQLGVQGAEIDNEAKDEVNIDELLGVVDNARSDVFKSKFADAIKADIVTETTGKNYNVLRSLIKKATGLTESDVAGLSPEEVIKKGIEKVKVSGSQSAEEVRKQMEEALSEWDAKYQKAQSDYEAEKNGLLDKFEQQEVDKLIFSELDKAPILAGDKAKIAKLIKGAISERGAIVRAGEKLEIRDKENREKPILNGNSVVQFGEVLQDELKSIGLWQTDTRNVKVQGQQPQPARHPEGSYVSNNGLADAMAQLAEL